MSLWALTTAGQLPPSAQHNFSVAPQGGFFPKKVEVSIDMPPSVKVFYTTNGRIPSSRQKPYSKPFLVSKTTVVRFLAVFPDKKRRYRAYTYFVGEKKSTVPVLSLSLPPHILFDPDYGLYVEGPKSTHEKSFGDKSNYWSTREIPAHFEFFETDSTEVFNGLVGLRIFGGISRTFPQKSFALVARKKYGHKWIKHPVFGEKGLSKFKYLVLRNSGSDWGRSHLRDGFMTTLVEDWNITKQDYRPAQLYINGKYWGLYNIREKVNRTFVAQHFDVNKNKIDLLEHRMTVKKGGVSAYRKLLEFLKTTDLSKDDNFAKAESLMDVDNFLDQHIAQIYFNNTDAGGNIKFWREQTPAAKWRWILYDTDWGFGLNGRKDYRKNSLKLFTEKNGKGWPHPDWSTFILRQLLTNKDFERRFINRFSDRLNTTLKPKNVKALLGQMAVHIQPEMKRHQKRWGLGQKQWKKDLGIMKHFAEKRPEYMIRHLKYKFRLDSLIAIKVQSGEGGHVILNDNLEITEPFKGKYFSNNRISLKAVADNGFQFVGWQGIDEQKETLTILPTKLSKSVKAIFERYIHPLNDKLVINEVSANNFESGDWVELLNFSDEPIVLENLILRDEKHEFKVPKFTLSPNSFLVICQDTSAFRKVHPNVKAPVVGNLGFGLNKRKEKIGLYSETYAVIDEFEYNVEAKDEFQSLALLAPNLENSRFENWEVLDGNGTPGEMNPYFVLSKIQATQAYYSKIGLVMGVVFILLMILYVKHSESMPRWAHDLYQRLPETIKSKLAFLENKKKA